MQRYLIRALKATVLLLALAALVFVISYYLGRSNHPGVTFMDLVHRSDITSLVLFLVIF